MRYRARMERLERELARRRPPQPALVVIHSGDGYTAFGQRFDTLADAKAAFVDRAPVVVVEIEDHRAPPDCHQ